MVVFELFLARKSALARLLAVSIAALATGAVEEHADSPAACHASQSSSIISPVFLVFGNHSADECFLSLLKQR